MIVKSLLPGLLALSHCALAMPSPDLPLPQIIKDGKITKGDPKKFHFVDIPTTLGLPCDMETASDGAEWVQFLFSEKIAKIDPNTHKITEQYDIPFTGSRAPNSSLPNANKRALLACVLRNGADGNLYAANGLRNQLVKLDMKTKVVSVYDTPGLLSPIGNLQPLNDLWGAPEGMYFSQSTANLISLFDYHTHKVESWPVPTPASLPLGMRTAYDGRLWFTELGGQKIGALNHKTGHIQEFPLPVPKLLGPAVLRVQTDSKYVWFTGALSDSIGRLNIYNGKFKVFPNDAPLSYAGIPSEITEDGKGYIWFDTWTQNLIHRLDRHTGKMEHIQVPGTKILAPVSAPFGFGIGIDYYPPKNQIYFTLATLNKVVVYDM